MNLPTIINENDALYLTQDLSGMGLYDKSKAIVDFCNKETKIFETEIDRAILRVFEKYGINIYSKDKSVLKRAFDILNANGVKLEIIDLYRNVSDSELKFVKTTKNHFTVVIENDNLIQCGVLVKEIRKD